MPAADPAPTISEALNDDAAERIAGALEEATMPQRVVAGVLVEQSRIDKLDLIVLVDLIGESMPVITAVPDHSPMEFGVGAFGLIHA
jgi:hypothetical protein